MIDTVELRVAGWKHQINLQLRKVDALGLPAKLLESQLDAMVDGHTLLIAPGVSRRGKGARIHVPTTRTRLHEDWPVELEFGLDGNPGATKDIGYFGIMEIEAEVDEESLILELPPAHRRPWPQFRRRTAESATEELMEELRRRLLSARLHDENVECTEQVRRALRPHWAGVVRRLETEGWGG